MGGPHASTPPPPKCSVGHTPVGLLGPAGRPASCGHCAVTPAVQVLFRFQKGLCSQIPFMKPPEGQGLAHRSPGTPIIHQSQPLPKDSWQASLGGRPSATSERHAPLRAPHHFNDQSERPRKTHKTLIFKICEMESEDHHGPVQTRMGT